MVKAAFDKILYSALHLFLIINLISAAQLFGAGKWMLSSSIQHSRGNYIFDTSTSTLYFYGGLRYQTPRWSVSASLPVIRQNSDLVTQTGGMFLPTGQSYSDDNSNTGGDHHQGGMFTGGGHAFSGHEYGLGDLYIYGAHLLLAGQGGFPRVSLEFLTKIPTANENMNYGTGKFDYGGAIKFLKQIGAFNGFMDIGYITIGDPQGFNYKNPLTFGLGAGKTFNNGRYSLLLYYQSYSEIIESYAGPSQISMGFNFRTSRLITLSSIVAAGLNKSSYDASFLAGVQVEI